MTDSQQLISAIHTDQLSAVDDPQARAICEAIGKRLGDDVSSVIDHLAETGIDATIVGDPTAAGQRHGATISVADADTAMSAVEAMTKLGYVAWDAIGGAAGTVLRRFKGEITMARTTDVTVAIGVRWPVASAAARVPEALVPNENDFDLVSLPNALWPAYFLIRPARLVAERLNLRPSSTRALGPFLSTPIDLVPPLLDLAQVDDSDVVVDLGCGDGRILIDAATRRGCRGIGVESNSELVAQARRQVATSGLRERVEIVHGDAAAAALPASTMDGTVFFVFVPSYSAVPLVERILAQAKPGSRVIAHEQHRLVGAPAGATSVPIMEGQGVTVAHLWTVPEPR